MILTSFSPASLNSSIRCRSSEPALVPMIRPRNRGGKAKTLDKSEFQQLVRYIRTTSQTPEADLVKVYLSVGAGLRACEISGLRISDVTNANGSTSDVIRIRAGATKGGRAREIPICPELRRATDDFRSAYPGSEWLAVSHVGRCVRHQNANAVASWFHRLYQLCGLQGCSSHTGRRTYITTLARNLGPGLSLRDVQRLAGHARLDTTQGYIEYSSDARRLANTMSGFFGDSHGGANVDRG